MHLTERMLKSLKWEGRDRLVSAGDNLFLNLRQHSKTWLLRRRVDGRMQVRTLGKWPRMPVREARAMALAIKLEGQPSEVTVEQLAERYMLEVVEVEHRRPALFRGYLDRAIIPALGSRRAVEVTAAEIAATIVRYKSRGPRAADQLRSGIKSLFAFAVDVGIRADNPAAALTRRVSGYRPVHRSRVLADEELRLLWAEDHPNARVLRFLVLTGLRISEAQKGRLEGERWTVPAEISKNGKTHWVHVTPEAAKQLPMPLCTPTNVQAWTRRWCKRVGLPVAFVPHDCRRTAATRMADAGVEPFVVERVLNHTLQGMQAVYNKAEYADERIAAARTLERVIREVVQKE